MWRIEINMHEKELFVKLVIYKDCVCVCVCVCVYIYIYIYISFAAL